MTTAKSLTRARSATSVGVMPVRRDVTFDLPSDRVHDGANGNV